MKSCDVLIIGGGLSGLQTANRLHSKGVSFQLIEARARLGGRIFSVESSPEKQSTGNDAAVVDMGPSWFWPGQRDIENLINELGLEAQVFGQYSGGQSVIEYNPTRIDRVNGAASMAGAYRLQGGLQHLIKTLSDRLPTECIHVNTVAKSIGHSSDGVVVTTHQSGDVRDFSCQYVVIAAPPRVVANTIHFTPALEHDNKLLLKSVPTWMAAEAKFVAVYDVPFWRNDGLSGDGMSQLGPLVEIHDASPVEGGPYALFGFIGVPVAQRLNSAEELKQLAVKQLTRMFGEEAKNPLNTHLTDWATESYTCTPLDIERRGGHATVAITEHWNNERIIWAGTETADTHSQANGYIEGAVHSANRASEQVLKLLL